MIALEITMPLASTWPTREELAARNAVEDALMASPIGKCTGAGGGMGKMHLTYRVDSESSVADARAMIDEAMKRHMPNAPGPADHYIAAPRSSVILIGGS